MIILKIIGTIAIVLNAMFMYGLTSLNYDPKKLEIIIQVACNVLILYLIWN